MTPEEVEALVARRAQEQFLDVQVERRARELLDDQLALEAGLTGWEPIKLTAAIRPPKPSVCEYAPGEHLFTPGYVHVVFGPGESGKTWLAYIAAAQEVRKGNQVLIVDYEIGDSLALDRLHDLGLTDEQIDEHVVYVSPEMTLTERLRLGLVDHVEDHGPPLTLMIIDTLGESATMAGLSTNDDSDMVSWFRSTTRWVVRQWPTCAVVVIDHLPKDKVDAEFPIGSQRKRAYPHALFSVRSVTKMSRTAEGQSVVTVRKSRDGHLPSGEAVAVIHGGPAGVGLGPVSRDDAKVVREMEIRSEITGYLSEHPDAKVRAIVRDVKGSTESINDALKAMAAEGLVTMTKVGNSHCYRLTGDVIEVDASRA